MKKLFYSESAINSGLLFLRLGIGIAFILHGYPKLFQGGADHLAGWLTKVGMPAPTVGAYLAAIAEFFGGIFLIIGLLFRPTSFVLAVTMGVAIFVHLKTPTQDTFMAYSHALESCIVFVALLISGPGRYSLDALIFRKKD